jgi:hypothetical protein
MILFWCSGLLLLAQSQTYLNQIYELPNGDNYSIGSLTERPESVGGGYAMMGLNMTTGKLCFTGTNPQGDTLFTQSYFSDSSLAFYLGIGLANLQNGGYAYATVATSANKTRALIMMLDENGNLTDFDFIDMGLEVAGYDICATTDGGFAVTGWVRPTLADDYQIIVMKFDATGNQSWVREYGNGDRDYGISIAQTPDGGYVIGGQRGFPDFQTIVPACPTVLKIDSVGNQEWQRQYSPGFVGEHTGCTVSVLPSGDYVFLAGWWNETDYLKKPWCGRIDINGTLVWEKQYESPYLDVFTGKPIVTIDGDIVMASLSNNVYGDAWLTKLNGNGEVKWESHYLYSGVDKNRVFACASTRDGGFLLGGDVIYNGFTDYAAWLIKTDSLGCAVAGCKVTETPSPVSEDFFNVFPNPAQDRVQFGGSFSDVVEWQLMDLNGRVLFAASIAPGGVAISLPSLPPGIYLWQAQEDGGIATTGKLIISN